MTIDPSSVSARLELVMHAAQKGRKRLAWILIPPGIAMAAAGLWTTTNNMDAALALLVIGGLTFLLGLTGVIGVLRASGPIRSVTRAIREHPRELLWVYGFQQTVNGRPSRSAIIFRTRDGKELDLDAGSLAPLTKDEIFAYARSIQPDVMLGYDDDNAKKYRALVKG